MKFVWPFSKHKKTEEVRDMAISGPVHPTGVEKFILTDGSYRLIYRPRVSTHLEGKRAVGAAVDDDGTITPRTTMLSLSVVTNRVLMGWDHGKAQLVEMDGIPVGSRA